MRHSQRTYATVLVALLILLAGCESTMVTTNWKDPSARSLAFKKVAIVVLNSTPVQRRSQEGTIASQITRATAVPSYTFIGDGELSDVPAAKQKIIAGGFDGAVVVKLLTKDVQSNYVQAGSATWDEGLSGRTYTRYGNPEGQTIVDTYFHAEINLYSVPAGNLLWSGTSQSLNPEDERAFAKQVAQATAAELRKQGLLQ